MPRLTRTGGAGLAAVLLAALVAGCMVKNTEAPPLSGPSELGLALSLSATPDILPQDGWSQAVVAMEARGPDGRPSSALSVRIETVRGGVVADYGTLSSRSVVTDANGRATVTYTAPSSAEPVDTNTVVTVRVTPIGTNYGNSVPREVQIRLTPPGVISARPTATFNYSPTSPSAGQDIYFSALASMAAPGRRIVVYNWDFGSGRMGAGATIVKGYDTAGSYVVTLQVIDDAGLSAVTSQTVQVQGTLTAGGIEH